MGSVLNLDKAASCHQLRAKKGCVNHHHLVFVKPRDAQTNKPVCKLAAIAIDDKPRKVSSFQRRSTWLVIKRSGFRSSARAPFDVKKKKDGVNGCPGNLSWKLIEPLIVNHCKE